MQCERIFITYKHNIGTFYTYKAEIHQTTISLPLKNSVCFIIKQNKTSVFYLYIYCTIDMKKD